MLRGEKQIKLLLQLIVSVMGEGFVRRLHPVLRVR
jgi:hypothetical protein